MAKRNEQSVHTVRQLIDTIAIPRLTLAIERERGTLAARALVFDGDLCRIGTHSSNDLVLADPAVSRFHCRLVREDGGWCVRDTGSLNGTKLDGVRIRDADLPPEGALLSLGDSIVRVKQAAAEREAILPMIPSFGAITGTSMAMRKLFAMLEKVAQSDINVLIEGESGTGKELVATEIVQRGTRADKPFVIVDCGAISPNLVESEQLGRQVVTNRTVRDRCVGPGITGFRLAMGSALGFLPSRERVDPRDVLLAHAHGDLVIQPLVSLRHAS